MKDRIKEIRTSVNKSQTEFAKTISVSRSAICKMESGENYPSEQTISLICKEFNVNEEWLRTGEGEMFNELDMENELMAWAGRVLSEKDDSFKKRFVKMLMSLDEDEWEFLAKKSMMLAGLDK